MIPETLFSADLPLPTLPIALSTLSVAALVLCDLLAFRPGRYVFKPLAAAAFIWLAWSVGASESSYGCWMLAGLSCCLLGDLFLMSDSDRFFLGGLFSFLLGHLLYALAFVQLPGNTAALAVSAVPVLGLVIFTWRWLDPFLKSDMRIGVALYILVIAGMLLSASMTTGLPRGPLILCGAVGFAISDLAVARQQFVKSAKINGLWGTPLYFFSQMLLALSTAH